MDMPKKKRARWAPRVPIIKQIEPYLRAYGLKQMERDHGFHQPDLSNWINGVSDITATSAEALVKALDLEIIVRPRRRLRSKE